MSTLTNQIRTTFANYALGFDAAANKFPDTACATPEARQGYVDFQNLETRFGNEAVTAQIDAAQIPAPEKAFLRAVISHLRAAVYKLQTGRVKPDQAALNRAICETAQDLMDCGRQFGWTTVPPDEEFLGPVGKQPTPTDVVPAKVSEIAARFGNLGRAESDGQ